MADQPQPQQHPKKSKSIQLKYIPLAHTWEVLALHNLKEPHPGIQINEQWVDRLLADPECDVDIVKLDLFAILSNFMPRI